MRRPPRGGTTHPAGVRPGYGFGRLPRPRALRDGAIERPWLDPSWWTRGTVEVITERREAAPATIVLDD